MLVDRGLRLTVMSRRSFNRVSDCSATSHQNEVIYLHMIATYVQLQLPVPVAAGTDNRLETCVNKVDMSHMRHRIVKLCWKMNTGQMNIT